MSLVVSSVELAIIGLGIESTNIRNIPVVIFDKKYQWRRRWLVKVDIREPVRIIEVKIKTISEYGK